MIIQEDDFRATLCKGTGTLFDLELLEIINKGKANERKEFRVAAYGIPIEKVIKWVINYRIDNKYPNVITFKEYKKEFEDLVNTIDNSFKV